MSKLRNEEICEELCPIDESESHKDISKVGFRALVYSVNYVG